MGPSPGQRNPLPDLLLPSERKTQLSDPSNRTRRDPLHRLRRYPTGQQNRLYGPGGLLHHPHDRVVRSGHRAAPVDWAEKRPRGTVLDGFGGLCCQCYCSAIDSIFQHHVLFP